MSQLKSLETYLSLMNTNAVVHAFRTASQLGILDALADGQKTAPQLAEMCEVAEKPVELLLNVLTTVGVVERYREDFAMAPVMHLLPLAYRDLGDYAWQHLAGYVRSGVPIPQVPEIPLDDSDFFSEIETTMWQLTPSALEVAHLLDVGATRCGMRILELSAGSAVWSLSIAHADPDCQITLVDEAALLERGRTHAESIGVADRVTCVPGDYRNVDLPAGQYDLAIMANVAHRHNPEEMVSLLKQVHTWLAPQGELALIDVFSGQAGGEMQFAVFCLSVALRTNGQVHSPEALQDMIQAGGFQKPRYAHLKVPPHTMGLLLAEK